MSDMITEAKWKEIYKIIQKFAALEDATDNEDFSVYDFSGGNFDNAFESGIRAGEVDFARRLLFIIEK